MKHSMFVLCGVMLVSACSTLIPGSSGDAPSPPEAGIATRATEAAHRALAERLPLDDQSDYEDAERGLIAQIEAPAILDKDGNPIWAIGGRDFIEGEAPATVNPSLWRQSELTAKHGLFEVVDGIWQVRGYDLSVMTVISGRTGWIIVDPLTRQDTARAAMKLVNDTLGERPVTGVIYTHSHTDHFAGVRGAVDEADIRARNVPVLAPEGFSKEAVSEFLLAGNLMTRRATLMFSMGRSSSETTHVGSGLGAGIPGGIAGLILPTEEIGGTGQRRVVDGVTFEFIDANGTEAPAEFMFYLPELRALCTAEVATATFHNVLTPRGAKVRDTLKWTQVLDDTLRLYGDRSDVVFASHHWPTWGNENVKTFLKNQRDIYRYVHDQSMRRANAGATKTELAEDIPEPKISQTDFATRGYYGTLNHNAKAVYQHYFGWWDGVPAEYYEHPHVVTAARYVDAMGGMNATLKLGAKAFEDGDYRWAAEILNHAVFAEPENDDARNWLAAAYEQLGFQSESGAWRDYFLTGASELRNGFPKSDRTNFANPDFVKAVPTRNLFDGLAAKYNPQAMTHEAFSIIFHFPDTHESFTLEVGEDVVVPRVGESPSGLRVTVNRSDFDLLFVGLTTPQQLVADGKLNMAGDKALLVAFFGALDQQKMWFPVVTP